MAKKSSIAVIEWRRRAKIRAVDYLGGRCIRCGYQKCIRALSFHHREPEKKKFGLSLSSTRSWASIQAELDKCDLLCMNCHIEVEYEKFIVVSHNPVLHSAVTRESKDIAGSNPAATAILLHE